jgi:DNA-binding NarL/FixJ family response regulator
MREILMKTPSVPDCQVKVFVLSDVLLYREGLSRQLEKDRRVELTGAGPPTPELVSTLEFAHPDVIVMDLSMHDSLGIVRRIRERRPEVRIVAFAVSDLSEEIVACAKAGICGYIPKEGTIEDIVMTALHAARGELYCSPKFAAFLLEQVARAGPTPSPPPLAARLTARECEIVSLMQRGLSNKEIGRGLGISGATVKNHVHSILEKLAVRRRSQVPALLSCQPPTRDGDHATV